MHLSAWQVCCREQACHLSCSTRDKIAGGGNRRHRGTRRVTVATNMAGRGTDIKLHPTGQDAGGLHVLPSEFHESSRIDRQLFGRAGRRRSRLLESLVALDDELFCGSAAAIATAIGNRAEISAEGASRDRTLLEGPQPTLGRESAWAGAADDAFRGSASEQATRVRRNRVARPAHGRLWPR